jgi:hypothetical protein
MNAAVSFDHLSALACGRSIADSACPWCAPTCTTIANQRKRVLRIWNDTPGFISFYCARCEQHGYLSGGRARLPVDRERIAHARKLADQRHQAETARRGEVAGWLWSQRQPIEGTLAHKYLRETRGYRGQLPRTIGFLPARGAHAPAMIAAFGIAVEVEPGSIEIADHAVRGVHLTRLKVDGSKADAPAKITVGHSLGAPLVLAPPNDLLGLTVAEGVEDALSTHEATGLGAWAAGSASRLAALADAVPRYISAVSIVADDDPAGRKGSAALAQKLIARGISATVVLP